MCSGVMYDAELTALWMLALRRCSAAAIALYLADFPRDYRPVARA